MNQKKQLELLKNHKMSVIGLEEYRQSAVCIPLIEKNETYQILFEVRSKKINHQPGDICFPGGMIEFNEKPIDAAIRETCEELCINSEQIQFLGATDLLIGSSILVYPYSVLLKNYENTWNPSEVEEIFFVPLDFFLETKPEVYEIERKAILPDNFPYERIVGGKNYKWRKRTENIYFYQYNNYTIWGMTAKILYSFINIWKSLI
ncbi:MAG: NUDIX hydrolase [Lachnospiraceae bacterium]